ncbi:Na+/H+ antiporter family protein [Pseudoalteromonas spongiae]|uniref:Na+/H+ antiporter family protein n=1 Tax=Pseudoalteromonas spongiae TaxID=298657 RepID=UPI0037367563
MNSVVLGVSVMLILSLLRINVIVAMTIAAITTGLTAGLGLEQTLQAFNDGLQGGAKTALSYAMLGGFAVAIAKSGLTDIVADKLINQIKGEQTQYSQLFIKASVLSLILLVSISSQNLIPVHIAFIPILIPPLLIIFDHLKLDRRAIACVLTFGLATAYMVLPYGFGGIFLYDIVHTNLEKNALEIDATSVPFAMIIPAIGMLIGLIIAVFFTYRNERTYQALNQTSEIKLPKNKSKVVAVGIMAIVTSLYAQTITNSMILGGLIGVLIFTIFGVVKWQESSDIFSKGAAMMAMIGFIMIAAQGFASVIQQTNEVSTLVQSISSSIGDSKAFAAALILIIGLLITMGIGSSFSTVPIVATIIVPLAITLGFSPMATAALVGTAGALGDAGSPASDSTLGPTSGLNADNQHDHIRDTVIPTFIHFNIPLLIFGWIAAMVL